MVCIYCGNKTQVTNSREQKRPNQVWRRRSCRSCHAIFTSIESAAYERSFVVKSNDTLARPFSRDKLFITIYESCRHRTTALQDATALTDTILSKILKHAKNGIVRRTDIVRLTQSTLKTFDRAAAVHYSAYHSV